MSARVLSGTPLRAGVTDKERAKALEKKFRELGFVDRCCGRPRAEREWLLKIGGESAVHYYFEGYRRGTAV